VRSSAETPREAVVRTILALERSCLDADAALVERRWSDLEAAFAVQTRLTDELAELFRNAPDVAPENDAKVAERVRGVLVFRDDQLRRLCAYRDEVGRRLRAIGQVRDLSRTIGKAVASPAFVDSNV
jgi:hypothetical protein